MDTEDKEKIFTIMDKFLEPSTIKGIVALVGAVLMFFMKPEEANNWVTNITNFLLALYGVYQIIRDENGQIVKVAEKLKETGIIALTLVLIPIGVAHSAEVCIEAQIAEGSYILSIDGIEQELDTWNTYTDADGTWHCFDVIDTLSMGTHTFDAQAVHISGWASGWFGPFDAYRPGKSNNWKIRR